MKQKEKDLIVQKFNGHKTLTYIELSLISDHQILRALSNTKECPALLVIKTGEIMDTDGITIHPIFSNDVTTVEKLQARHFSATDIFHLTEYGEDILYQLQKERKDNILLWLTAICGLIAAITGILALIR